MVHVSVENIYQPRYVVLWMLLALKAGYLNAAGFLATGNFVSHVTGFGTNMGISLAHEDYLFGSELLVIPISFILGASIPAWILDWNYYEKKIVKFHYVQFLITFILACAFFAGITNICGEFTTQGQHERDIILAGSLCFVCGMKNALSVWASSGKIRTTHLTGLSTDIGLNIPKLFRRNAPCRFPEGRKVNTVRVFTFASFTLGSLIAAFVFPRMGFYGLLFPLALSTFFSVISYLSYKSATSASEKAKVVAAQA